MNTTATFETTVNNPLPSGKGTFHISRFGSVIFLPAESSAIHEVHYLVDESVMVITYKGGAKYYYNGVPAFVAFNLMVAESFGKFVNEHIKPHYEFTKN
jgi:hypothetical protein